MIRKYMYIVVNHIKTLIKCNSFLLTILLIGIIICNTVFIYFAGNVIRAYEVYGAKKYELLGNESVDVFQLNNMLNECDSVIFYSKIDKQSLAKIENQIYDTSTFLAEHKDDNIYIVTSPNLSDIMSDSSIVANIGTATIPLRLIENKGELPSLTINNNSYKIVGTTYTNNFFVSMSTFSSNNLIVSKIEIRLKAGLSNKEVAVFYERLEQLLGDSFIINDTTETDDNEIFSIFFNATIIYVIAIITLLYIVAYMFEEMSYELSVYELLGADRRTIITILCIIMFSILLFSSFVACVLHALLYEPVFTKLNVYEFTYSIEMYLLPTIITIITVMFFVYVFCRIKIKKYAVVNFQKFMK